MHSLFKFEYHVCSGLNEYLTETRVKDTGYRNISTSLRRTINQRLLGILIPKTRIFWFRLADQPLK